MSVYFRLMGLVAAACSRASRIRVNGIPSHVFIVLGVAFLVGILAMDNADHSQGYGKPPTPFATVHAAVNTASVRDYVTITGSIAPDVHVHSSGADHDSYAVLFDPKTKDAVFVQNAPASGLVTVSGLLYPVPTDLTNATNQIYAYHVTSNWLLQGGTTPNNPKTSIAVGVVLGILLLIFFGSVAQKHIIFERASEPYRPAASILDPAAMGGIDMRFSGFMVLAGKATGRFLQVPAAAGPTKSGKLAFFSRINASVSEEYGKLIDREGIWTSVVEPNTLTSIDSGRQYVGLSVRPALRVQYREALLKSQKVMTTVLSFGSVEQRDWARQMIEADSKGMAVAAPAPTTVASAMAQPAAAPLEAPSPTPETEPIIAPELPQPPPQALTPLVAYKASGKCPPSAFWTVLAAGVAAAAVVGVGYHFMAGFMDLPIISPAIAGMIAGGLVGAASKKTRCRSVRVLMAVGFLAGVLTYGVRLVADSQALRPLMVRSLVHRMQRRGIPASVATPRIESILDPVTTLRFYLDLSARSGVVMTNTNSTSYSVGTSNGVQNAGGTVISGIWYWLLLLAEALCCGLGAAGMLQLAGNKAPYCEKDDCWMKPTTLVNLAPRQTNQMLAVLAQQDWATLKSLKPQGAMNEQNYARVTVNRCPVCGSGTLTVVTQAGSQIKTVMHVVIDESIATALTTVNRPPPVVLVQ